MKKKAYCFKNLYLISKKIICINMLFVIMFSLCGCPFSFEQPYSYMCEYDYEETEYDIDDVTLKFYFGPSEKEIKYSLDNTNNWIYGNVNLFFSSEQTEISFPIREIPKEEFFSDSYLQKNSKGGNAVYNHSEMITIPKEIFTEEEGIIYFHVKIDQTLRETGEYRPQSAGTTIWYKLKENKVHISSKEFV